MSSCFNCGKPTRPEHRFCVSCGVDLSAPARVTAKVHCIACGATNPPSARFCSSCGQRFESSLGSAPLSSDGFPCPPRTRDFDRAPNSGSSAFTPGSSQAHAKLILLEEDGTEGGALELRGGPQWIGRNHGPPFDEDAYLDPNHAELTVMGAGLQIDSDRSLNGVFLKLDEPCELQHDDQFRVGQELIRYQDLPDTDSQDPAGGAHPAERLGSPNPGYWGRLSVMLSPTLESRAIAIGDEGALLGREAGELCFPNDGYVSARHCRVFTDRRSVWLEDLESSNGTYMRVRKNQIVPFGGLLLIGQQLFRLSQD